jgi:hypothetical protein
MKSFLKISTALLGVTLGLSTQLSAITVSTADALGYVFPGSPANPTDEVGYINTLIVQPLNSGPTLISGQNYTRSGVNPGALPTANTTGAQKDDTSPSNVVNTTGYEYILGKYDAQNAGTFIWYIAGQTEVTIPTTALDHQLSHWSLYNATGTGITGVPDGGLTVALLGAALAAVALAARKLT